MSAAGATHFGTGLSELATMRGSPAASPARGSSSNASSSNNLAVMQARPSPNPVALKLILVNFYVDAGAPNAAQNGRNSAFSWLDESTGPHMTVSWNYNRAEIIADGIVHAVGAALAVA